MASVLKSTCRGNAAESPAISGLVGFNFEDLSQQARQQLQQCQQEIAALRAQADEEIETLRQEAYAEGLAAGRAEAARQAEAKLQAAVQQRVSEHGAALQSMVEQIADGYQQWMQQYADSLVPLVIAAAERIIRGRLDREPQIVLRWANDALAAARSAERLTIAVHPQTLGQLGPGLDELLNQPGLPEETSIIPDESVPVDGVVVRQTGGEVTATFDSQLGRLRELLDHA